MKKLLFLFATIFSLVFVSCSSDDDSASLNTKAKIILKDGAGRPVEGKTVYVFDETTWDLYGFDEFFAKKQGISNENGVVEFNNMEGILGTYMNDNSENFYFGVKYVLDSTNKRKSEGRSFTKGETKEITITLN